jgi:hypothetical protein
LLAYVIFNLPVLLAIGVAIYGIAYKLSKKFRFEVETRCYLEQISHYPPERNVMWAAKALSESYNLDLTLGEARAELKINSDGFYRP